MNKTIFSMGLAFVLIAGMVMACPELPKSVFAGGWADCAVSGSNYGNIGTETCKVSWNGVTQACNEQNRDAKFTVGTHGRRTTEIIINHLDGIANDSFAVMNGKKELCRFEDITSGTEEWKDLVCDVNIVGVKTLTIHPLANAWVSCDTYGQVAVHSINFETEKINKWQKCHKNLEKFEEEYENE